MGKAHAYLSRTIEQEVRIGRVADEVLVRVEATLLRHIDAGERDGGVVLLVPCEVEVIRTREAVAVGGHEGQPVLTRDIASEHPFALPYDSKLRQWVHRSLDIAPIEVDVVLVVDELRVLPAGVVVEAVLPCADMVVDIATDALVEGAGLDRDPAIAVACPDDGLIATLAGEVTIPLDPIGAVLQPDSVELVDIGWAPRPADIRTHIPVLIDIIVSGEARGEVAIQLEVVVVGIVTQAGVATDRHHAEVIAHTECSLELAQLSLVEEVAPHRECSEVRHEGRLLRPRVVVVRLVGIRRTDVGSHPPAIPLGVPEHVRLEGLEDEILHRYPAPVGLLTILELLSEVLLE